MDDQAKYVDKDRWSVDDEQCERGTHTASIIMVIQTTANRGNGTPEHPTRIVTQYWSLDGKLLWEEDPYYEEG